MRSPLKIRSEEISFHNTVSAWFLVIFFIGAAGLILARVAPAPLPDLEKLQSKFVPGMQQYVAPESEERRLYILLTLSTPPAIFGAWTILRRFTKPKPHSLAHRPFLSKLRVGSLGVLLANGLLVWLIIRATDLPIPKIFEKTSGLFLIYATAVVLWLSLLWPIKTEQSSSWWKVWRRPTLALAFLCTLFTAVSLKIFDEHTANLANFEHLNTAFASITQAWSGQRMMIDFVPQYGCYGEMLKPWLSLIGPSVLNLTLTMVLLQFAALTAIIMVLHRLLRSRVLLLLAMVVLAWIMIPWSQLVLDSFDPYYQYFPIRLLCPAFSIWATCWFFLAVATSSAVLGAITFYLYLCLISKQWIDLSAALTAQQQFYINGFYMIAMPTHPSSAASLQKLTIGNNALGTGPFQGDIAEVKIHGQALAAKMIQTRQTRSRQ